jgi:hypothetical protein
MLNMAVVAMPDTSDLYASDYEVLSRMAGVLSFNGDIAQWSDAAVQRVRALVDVYKQIRPLLSGTAHFPLRQPTSIDDWDVVVFEGNVNSRRLIFAYRMSGTSSASFCLPPTSVDQLVHNVGWEQLAGPASARLASKDARLEIELPPYSAAIWREA